MAKIKLSSLGGLVYSTNPDFKIDNEQAGEQETLLPAKQPVKVGLDAKHRGGKTVTLVRNFIGAEKDREELGKKLKSYCGTGGSVKDGDIIVQGDNRDKILQWLLKSGYTAAKKS